MPIFGNIIKQVHSKINTTGESEADAYAPSIPKRTAFQRGDVITTWEKKLPVFQTGGSAPSSSIPGKILTRMKKMDTAVVAEDCNPGDGYIVVRYESVIGYVQNDTEKVQHAMEYTWWINSGKTSELRRHRVPQATELLPKEYHSWRLYQALYPAYAFADPTLKVFTLEIPAHSLLLVRSARPSDNEHHVPVSLCLVGTRDPENGFKFVASDKTREHLWVNASKLKEFLLTLVNVAALSSAMTIAKPVYYQVGEVYRLIGHQSTMSDAEGRVLREIPTGSILSIVAIDSPSWPASVVKVRSATDGTSGWITAMSSDTFLLEKIPECRLLADHIIKGESSKAIKRILTLEERGLSNIPILNGNNALHMACQNGRSAIVDRMCASSKTNVMTWNANGENAAHCIILNNNVACSVGRNEKSLVELKIHVLKLLRDAKADMNAGDNLGRTPLMYCARFIPVGAVPVADFLLTFKADPNACSSDNKNTWQHLKIRRTQEKQHLRALLLQVLLKHYPAGEPEEKAPPKKITGPSRPPQHIGRNELGKSTRPMTEYEMKRLEKKIRAKRDRQDVMAAVSPSCLFVKSNFALARRAQSPSPSPRELKEEKKRFALEDLLEEDLEKKNVHFAEVLQSTYSAPPDYVPQKGNLGKKRRRNSRSRNSVCSAGSAATFKGAAIVRTHYLGRRSRCAPMDPAPKSTPEATQNQVNRWAEEKVRETAPTLDKLTAAPTSDRAKGAEKGKGGGRDTSASKGRSKDGSPKDKGPGKGTHKSNKGR